MADERIHKYFKEIFFMDLIQLIAEHYSELDDASKQALAGQMAAKDGIETQAQETGTPDEQVASPPTEENGGNDEQIVPPPVEKDAEDQTSSEQTEEQSGGGNDLVAQLNKEIEELKAALEAEKNKKPFGLSEGSNPYDAQKTPKPTSKELFDKYFQQ